MALQDKIVASGPKLSAFGMVLKFIVGPTATTICAVVVGLRGDFLRVAIIQAALPQSISSFIFAREYGLHPDVLSTAVIFGTLVSLPVLIAYYEVLVWKNKRPQLEKELPVELEPGVGQAKRIKCKEKKILDHMLETSFE
ncbi:auxin efflux carrier [Musa troglodytarum]|nr:auxin efflux carrier [Musa troglodytarum]